MLSGYQFHSPQDKLVKHASTMQRGVGDRVTVYILLVNDKSGWLTCRLNFFSTPHRCFVTACPIVSCSTSALLIINQCCAYSAGGIYVTTAQIRYSLGQETPVPVYQGLQLNNKNASYTVYLTSSSSPLAQNSTKEIRALSPWIPRPRIVAAVNLWGSRQTDSYRIIHSIYECRGGPPQQIMKDDPDVVWKHWVEEMWLIPK